MKVTRNTLHRILFLVCLLVGIMSFTVSAATTYTDDSGQYKFTLRNGGATITAYTGGAGSLYLPDKVDVTISGNTKTYTVKEIGDGYKSIISSAALEDVHYIYLSTNIESINAFAFANCTGLKYVVCNDDLIVIDAKAFKGCSSLQSIHLGKALETIGDYAFYGCTSLASVFCNSYSTTYPPTANYLGITSFDNYLPEKLTYLGWHAFQLTKLKGSLYIPGTISEIGVGTFFKCTALTDVYISTGIVEIDEQAFGLCKNLKRIYVPKSVTTIQPLAFSQSIIAGQTVVTMFEDSAMEDYMEGYSYKCFNALKVSTHANPVTYMDLYSASTTLWAGQALDIDIDPMFTQTGDPETTDLIKWKSYNSALIFTKTNQSGATVTSNTRGNGYMVKAIANNTASADITINVKSATKLTITESGKSAADSKHEFDIKSGSIPLTLEAITSPDKGAPGITWKSSNTSIATVNKNTGAVTIQQKEGTATITATAYNGVSGTYKITTKNSSKGFPGWSVPNTIELIANKSPYTIKYKNVAIAPPPTMKATSSNTSVASINGYNQIIPICAGYTKVAVFNSSNNSRINVIVKPLQQKITTSTVNGRKVKLVWKKQAGVSGYEVQYRSSSSSTYTTIKAARTQAQNYYTFSTLSAKTTYYFRVRGYVEHNGKRYYGKYSPAIKLKTQE